MKSTRPIQNIRYRNISVGLETYAYHNNKPKPSWELKITTWILANLIRAIINGLFEYADEKLKEAENKAKFKKRYKTIIKVNPIGFKSYEYHERD